MNNPIDGNKVNLNNVLSHMTSMKVVSLWGPRKVEIKMDNGNKVTVPMKAIVDSLKGIAKEKTHLDSESGRIKGIINRVRDFESSNRNSISMFFREKLGIGHAYQGRDIEFKSIETKRPKTVADLKEELANVIKERTELQNSTPSPLTNAFYRKEYVLSGFIPEKIASLKAEIAKRDKPLEEHKKDLQSLERDLGIIHTNIQKVKNEVNTIPGVDVALDDPALGPNQRNFIKKSEKDAQSVYNQIIEKKGMIENLERNEI